MESQRDEPSGDESTRTVPLDLDEGTDRVIEQQDLPGSREGGGGEWADPDAPPSDAAPGSAGMVSSPEPRGGQFAEAYEEAGEDASGSSS